MTIRQEVIIRGEGPPTLELGPGISIREFACGRIGAIGLSTGIARLAPGAYLPYHVHACGESVTVLTGKLESAVEGRTYHLLPYDCIHIPAGVPHSAMNIGNEFELILHNTFSSAQVTRTPVNTVFAHQDRSHILTEPGSPESLRRFSLAEEYELSKNILLRDLFGGRFGAAGISGELGLFSSGTCLPCHTSQFDGSITIVDGIAVFTVAGRRYDLSGNDTAFVPQGLPYQLTNGSEKPLRVIWAYAGDEPNRVFVENGLCVD